MAVSRSASESSQDERAEPRIVGRYALHGLIGAGGMASVHLGRLLGPVGFSRTVAVKRMHPHLLEESEFISMFVDEARLAARVRHPNVVATLDVVEADGELLLVMEYIHGVALWRMIKNATDRCEHLPIGILASVMSGVLQGLHAAHEAKGDGRKPLGLVHRDVSPHNILIGVDGVSRVLDFGVAKAAQRSYQTRVGHTRGKVRYMAPEQLLAQAIDRRVDIFAAGIVLWEGLTGTRLFDGEPSNALVRKILSDPIPEPREYNPAIPKALNDVVMRALQREPERRFQTAREFAIELERSVVLASTREVGEWVETRGGASLERRADAVAQIEGLGSQSDIKRELAEMQERRTRSTMSEPLSQSGERFVDRASPEPRRISRSSLTLSPPTSVRSTFTPSEGSALNSRPISNLRSNLQLAVFGLAVAALSFVTVWKFMPAESAADRVTHASQQLAPSNAMRASAERTKVAAAPEHAALELSTPLDSAEATQPTVSTSSDSMDLDQTMAPTNEAKSDEKPSKQRAKRRAAPRRSSVRRATTAALSTPSAKPQAACAMPFYVDAQGIKRAVKGCL